MPLSRKTRPAVIGVGMVGGALARYFDERGYDPILHDPAKGHENTDGLQKAEIVFVCVPTPHDATRGGFDLSSVRAALTLVSDGATVIIKSTILPGTTEQLQQERPRLKLAFNPEFLREKTAYEDMIHPDRQLLGVTAASASQAQDIMAWLPTAPFARVMPATAAEAVKYFGNAFLALKVIYANQLYDLCQAVGADYELVKESAAADPRIGPSHLDVGLDGYRGYGGHCFPKDVRSLIDLGDRCGTSLDLLKTVEAINNRLRSRHKDE